MHSRIDGTTTNSTQTTALDQPANLGGQTVEKSKGNPLRALADIGRSIVNFFRELPSSISAFFQKRSEASEMKAQQRYAEQFGSAAKSLFEDLKKGDAPTGRILDNLNAMLKNAGRIDAQDKAGVIDTFIEKLLSEVPDLDLEKLALCDLDKLKSNVGTQVENNAKDVGDLNDTLATFDLAGDYEKTAKTLSSDTDTRVRDLEQLVDSLKSGLREERLNRFAEKLGPSIPMDDNGYIDTTMTTARVNVEGTKIQSPIEWVVSSANGKLEKHAEATIKPEINGVKITSEALADWHRINIEFKTPDGNSTTSRAIGGASSIKERQEASANALRQIVGDNDNATVIVSSLLNQNGWRDLVRGVIDPNGHEVKFRALPNGYDSATIKGQGGDVVVDEPGQIGEAQFSIERDPNGDFKISVNWTFASNGIVPDGGFNAVLPMDKRNPTSKALNSTDASKPINALGVEFSTTITVSRTEAEQGRIGILGNPVCSHRIFGQYNPD